MPLVKEEKKQKIGILGGTFDPVHKGHLAVARSVLDRYQLDRILFIPAFSPPHKDKELTSFAHRVAMLEVCLEHTGRMSVSILEAERNAPSYTVETLHELHQRMESSTFYLIMGADMFVELELWYRYSELFQLATIIVAARPGISLDKVMDQAALLPGDFKYDPEQQKWTRSDGAEIFYYTDIAEPVSSSEIRSRLLLDKPVAEFLSTPVRDYIRENGLYASSGNEN